MVVIKLLELKAHMWHKIYNVFIKITDVLYEKSMRAYNKALERIERVAEDGRTEQIGSSDKFNLPRCQCTDEEIAKSFIEDVQAVKDQLPCGEQMDFPNTFDEFAKEYGFKDKNEIYTNGSELIPVFRVKQWLEHISTTKNDLAVSSGLEKNSKKLEKDFGESNCIDREEILKAMDTWDKFGNDPNEGLIPLSTPALQDRYVPYVKYEDMVNCVKGMPSVTPQPCEDSVSRKAINGYIDYILSHGMGKKKSFDFIKKFVANLPTVTPQEPKPMVEIDLYSVIKQSYIEREILDKIRAEIVDLGQRTMNDNRASGIWACRDIIDKYKAESEDKE